MAADTYSAANAFSMGEGKRRATLAAAVFCLFLAWFLWNGRWHIPSQLHLTGTTQTAAELVLSWDSGAGFNDLESVGMDAGIPLDPSVESHRVTIRRTGHRNPLSAGSHVTLKEIVVDDRPLQLHGLDAAPGVSRQPGDTLYFEHNGAALTFRHEFNVSIRFRLVIDDASGQVEIDLDGNRRTYDLYAADPGNTTIHRRVARSRPGVFSVSVPLPRYDVRRWKIASFEDRGTFRLTSGTIQSTRGQKTLPLTEDRFASAMVLPGGDRGTVRFLHPVRLSFQVLYAAFLTLLMFRAARFTRERGGWKTVLAGGRRPVFWAMFGGALLTFSLWLLAYWPGNLTTDSIDVWRIAKIPGGFLHKHPFMNVVYYRFLQMLWDHPAVVGLFQITATAGLGSCILYEAHKQGVQLPWLLPFYLLFICSVPVGLYNISLWKDTPFALMVLFWAFYLGRLYRAKRSGAPLSLRGQVPGLALALAAVCLFRHNGIVYAVILPALLLLLNVVPLKRTLLGLAAALAVLLALAFLVLPVLEQTDFLRQQSRIYLNRLKGMTPSGMAKRVARNYVTILDINRHKAISDLWVQDAAWIEWHTQFTRQKGWNDFVRHYPSEPVFSGLQRLANAVHRASYSFPWVYLSWNPFYLYWLFPLLPVLFRPLPLSAIFSLVVVSQAVILIAVFWAVNWRYYYFLCLAAFFVVPAAMMDFRMRRATVAAVG